MVKLKRFGPGVYETTDGLFRIFSNHYETGEKPWWYLIELDSEGNPHQGDGYWNDYPTLQDCREAIAEAGHLHHLRQGA